MVASRRWPRRGHGAVVGGLTLSAWLVTTAGSISARAEDTLMPRIVHEACGEYEKGQSFTIIARFEDESQLYDPKAMFRVRDESPWRAAPFAKDPTTDNFVAVVEAKELRGPLQYFIEVFDAFGNGPARLGTPEAPLRVVPSRHPPPCRQVPATTAPVVVETPQTNGTTFATDPQPPPPQGTCDRSDRPLYCEPWLWAAAGTAVLAATGVTVYFAAFADERKPARPRDSVTLIIVGPDPTDQGLRLGRW